LIVVVIDVVYVVCLFMNSSIHKKKNMGFFFLLWVYEFECVFVKI